MAIEGRTDRLISKVASKIANTFLTDSALRRHGLSCKAVEATVDTQGILIVSLDVSLSESSWHVDFVGRLFVVFIASSAV